MVVNPQGDVSQIPLEFYGQHTGGSHVHGHQGVTFRGFFLGQSVMQPGKTIGNLVIFQQMGGFAHIPQNPAKGSGRTQGIAVGTAVGQNRVVIMGQQKVRCLIQRQFLHRASLPGS